MVIMSIDFLSDDGSVIRSRNENGSCSLNRASVLPPKWKPRKVSAVRDFPPGCGPKVQPVHVVSQEAEASSSLVDNINGANDAGKTGTKVESLIVEPMNAVVQVDDVKLLSPTHGKDNGDSVVKEAKPKMKFPRRRFSAVRDFPPYCGLNAPEPTQEERIRINGINSFKTNDNNAGEESNGSLKDEFLHKTQSDESSKKSTPQNGGKTFIGQACQELVVYMRNKDLKRRSSVDSQDEDTEDESIKNCEPLDMVSIPENRSLALIQKDIKNTKKMEFIGDKRIVVMGLRAASLCVEKSRKSNLTKMDESTKESKAKGQASRTPMKSIKKKTETPKTSTKKNSGNKEESSSTGKVPYTGTLEMVVRNEEDFVVETEDQPEEYPTSRGPHDVDVTLPPFGPKSSNDARNKVRETLRLFQALCRKLLQGEEAKTNDVSGHKLKRVDLAAKDIIQEKGRALDRGKKTYGPVPGIEVGDEFQYRVELALVGIHRTLQGGIDYVRQGKDFIALSVVASGGYDNELDKPDCLIYCGSGGIGKDKQVEDQKLERGNLALKNNIHLKIPVRVIRGYKVKPSESSDSKSRVSTTYIYDGLYTVEKYIQEPGPQGNLIFKFELIRIPGQPELALREVKSKKFKIREGVCVKDIANGKEVFRICAVNTINDEKPPSFNYITKIVYPDWYRPVPPKGCDCVGRCSDKRCSCAFKNGGEIPYNHNGAIVEAKPLVYECGPSCRCPPSCYNRVTQHGMKIQLEIFKTESRGWGVRSLSSISSGSFICEYIGELLEDTEAEKRTGNDEYLFDIGQNYNDCSLNPDVKASGDEIVVSTGGFTIDAAYHGNLGRFINHSCSPNLYAQNVLYDQEDKRMPHIMLFAAENIPPLQELTYHYNYAIDTVHDSDGNIKIKKCYCGSSECTGRLY